MELQELAGRIRNGDKDALQELISVYGGDVYQKAYEKAKDPELAREATRRTFAQFVMSLQERAGADGWSLWLDALAGKNIETFRRVSEDVDWVGRELEGELFGSSAPQQLSAAPAPACPAPRAAARPQPETGDRPQRRHEPASRGIAQPSRPITERTAGRKKTRSERLFPTGPVSRKRKRKSGGGAGVALLFALCLFLIWVVLGVAMSLSWLPKIDLGYAWFNANVCKFF